MLYTVLYTEAEAEPDIWNTRGLALKGSMHVGI